jgi:hypothetical protein
MSTAVMTNRLELRSVADGQPTFRGFRKVGFRHSPRMFTVIVGRRTQ